MKTTFYLLASFAFLVGFSENVHAQSDPVFFGPTPYLSSADIPEGFYAGGAPDVLVDFEDGLPHPVMNGTIGGPMGPHPRSDSVDADDGAIDGHGFDGICWNVGSGAHLYIYFSPPLPTAAGLVWTDGTGGVSFEAYDHNHDSMGIIGPFDLEDGLNTGGTAEDRFFGVQKTEGILRIDLRSSVSAYDPLQVDHVQYGSAGSVVGVPNPGSVVHLRQNIPNPFNPQTTIAFEIPRQQDVALRVFDISGRLVRNLVSGVTYTPGRHEIVWNGRDDAGRQVTSGTYFYRLETGEFAETKRMVLVK